MPIWFVHSSLTIQSDDSLVQSIELSAASDLSCHIHGYQKYVPVPPADESPLLDLGKTTLIFTGTSGRLSNFLNGHVVTTRMVSSDDVHDEENRAAFEETAEVRVSLHSEDSLNDYNIADYADLAYASDERNEPTNRGFERMQPVAMIPGVVVSPSLMNQAESISGNAAAKRKLKKKVVPHKEEPKTKERPVATEGVPVANPRKSKVTSAQSIKQPGKDIASPRKQPANAVMAGKSIVSKSRIKQAGVAAPLWTNSNPVLRPKSSVEPVLTSRSKVSEKTPTTIFTKSASGYKEDRLTTALLRKSFGVVSAIKSDTKKGPEKAKITRRSS